MKEQETFGIDHATARNVVRLLPSELTADEQWNFVENTVMPALNRVYGNLPASDRRTQTLTMAMDNVVMHLMSVSHFDEPVPHETKQLARSVRMLSIYESAFQILFNLALPIDSLCVPYVFSSRCAYFCMQLSEADRTKGRGGASELCCTPERIWGGMSERQGGEEGRNGCGLSWRGVSAMALA